MFSKKYEKTKTTFWLLGEEKRRVFMADTPGSTPDFTDALAKNIEKKDDNSLDTKQATEVNKKILSFVNAKKVPLDVQQKIYASIQEDINTAMLRFDRDDEEGLGGKEVFGTNPRNRRETNEIKDFLDFLAARITAIIDTDISGFLDKNPAHREQVLQMAKHVSSKEMKTLLKKVDDKDISFEVAYEKAHLAYILENKIKSISTGGRSASSHSSHRERLTTARTALITNTLSPEQKLYIVEETKNPALVVDANEKRVALNDAEKPKGERIKGFLDAYATAQPGEKTDLVLRAYSFLQQGKLNDAINEVNTIMTDMYEWTTFESINTGGTLSVTEEVAGSGGRNRTNKRIREMTGKDIADDSVAYVRALRFLKSKDTAYQAASQANNSEKIHATVSVAFENANLNADDFKDSAEKDVDKMLKGMKKYDLFLYREYLGKREELVNIIAEKKAFMHEMDTYMEEHPDEEYGALMDIYGDMRGVTDLMSDEWEDALRGGVFFVGTMLIPLGLLLKGAGLLTKTGRLIKTTELAAAKGKDVVNDVAVVGSRGTNAGKNLLVVKAEKAERVVKGKHVRATAAQKQAIREANTGSETGKEVTQIAVDGKMIRVGDSMKAGDETVHVVGIKNGMIVVRGKFGQPTVGETAFDLKQIGKDIKVLSSAEKTAATKAAGVGQQAEREISFKGETLDTAKTITVMTENGAVKGFPQMIDDAKNLILRTEEGITTSVGKNPKFIQESVNVENGIEKGRFVIQGEPRMMTSGEKITYVKNGEKLEATVVGRVKSNGYLQIQLNNAQRTTMFVKPANISQRVIFSSAEKLRNLLGRFPNLGEQGARVAQSLSSRLSRIPNLANLPKIEQISRITNAVRAMGSSFSGLPRTVKIAAISTAISAAIIPSTLAVGTLTKKEVEDIVDSTTDLPDLPEEQQNIELGEFPKNITAFDETQINNLQVILDSLEGQREFDAYDFNATAIANHLGLKDTFYKRPDGKKGRSSLIAAQVQKFLQENGFGGIKVDGLFGPQSVQALKKYFTKENNPS